LTWPSPENYRFCPVCAGPLAERLLKPGEPKRLVCTRCGFIFYIDPKLAVLSVVPYQGGVVLVRRAIEPGYGLWVAPGGFVDVGEKVEEAVVRETQEESGLLVVFGPDEIPWGEIAFRSTKEALQEYLNMPGELK